MKEKSTRLAHWWSLVYALNHACTEYLSGYFELEIKFVPFENFS